MGVWSLEAGVAGCESECWEVEGGGRGRGRGEEVGC